MSFAQALGVSLALLLFGLWYRNPSLPHVLGGRLSRFLMNTEPGCPWPLNVLCVELWWQLNKHGQVGLTSEGVEYIEALLREGAEDENESA